MRCFSWYLSIRARAALWPIVVGCVLALSGCGGKSVDRPDFSGVWKLDADRSDFGPVPGPSEATHVIEHGEQRFRLTADSVGFMGERHAEFEFATDGSEQVQDLDGQQRLARTYWDQEALVTEWTVDNPGQPRFEMTDRRILSADGGTMTVEHRVRSDWSDWEQTAVFRREPAAP